LIIRFFTVRSLRCGDVNSTPSTPSDNTTNQLFTAVKQAVPAFQPSAKSAKATINDQAMMVAYQLLRDYTYPDDEGVVDMSNIYKVLWEAGRYLDEAPTRCATVAESVDSVVSPFAFNDFLGHSYVLGASTEVGGYGNSTTHAFDLKMAINGTTLVGKGISRGAGNYFLFRSGDAYYCLPAEATEADLAAIVPTDLANVPTEGAAYKDAVSAAVQYDVNTDLPNIDLSDFNLGVAGTPVSYLMF
jgi:hypothetical protein